MVSKTENFYKTEKVAWDVSKPGYLSESGNVTLTGDKVINVDLLKDTDWIWTNIPSEIKNIINPRPLTFADGYKPSGSWIDTPLNVRKCKHKLTGINLRSTKTPVKPIEDNYPPILLTDGLTKMKVYSDFLETFDIYTKVYDGYSMTHLSDVNPAGTLEQIILSHTPNLTTFSVGASGKLRELYVDDFSHVTSMREAFYANNSLEYVSPMYLDSCTDLSYMFAHCQFPEVPTTLHNTSNVKSTAYMFLSCKNITSVPLFDTSNVTNMTSMFQDCSGILSIPQFDTSNVTDMNGMFYDCISLTSVPMFNTQNVTDMEYMFTNCSNLTTTPLFNTQNVTDMRTMFFKCKKLTSVPLFNTQNVTSMYDMFYGCTSLTSVPLFNTQNVTDMRNMFYDCISLTSVPVFDTQNVTNMEYMFNGCKKLTSAPAFDVQNVTNMMNMFKGCTSLTTVSSINIPNATHIGGMFEGCTSLTSISEINTSKSLKDTHRMFYNCKKLTSIPEMYMYDVGTPSSYDTRDYDLIRDMFYGCTSLTDCGGFKDLRISIDLSACPLTHESAMNVINKVARPGYGTQTITFSRATFNTLSKEDIKIATDMWWEIDVA